MLQFYNNFGSAALGGDDGSGGAYCSRRGDNLQSNPDRVMTRRIEGLKKRMVY
ncbi:MAG: hypothetical protein LBR84_09295 [Tannerella sp.]|nr:hypothetical protein [Tannerella sp.]